MKLTEAQGKALQQIKDYINLAKKCETYKEYCIKENKIEPEIYEIRKEHYESLKKYWIEAKNKNIALTSCVSSSTLKSLEKKGLIKIIEDGGKYVDKVILL